MLYVYSTSICVLVCIYNLAAEAVERTCLPCSILTPIVWELVCFVFSVQIKGKGYQVTKTEASWQSMSHTNQSLISLNTFVISCHLHLYNLFGRFLKCNMTIGCNMSVCYVNKSLKWKNIYKQHDVVNDKPFCFTYHHFFDLYEFLLDTCMYKAF